MQLKEDSADVVGSLKPGPDFRVVPDWGREPGRSLALVSHWAWTSPGRKGTSSGVVPFSQSSPQRAGA